MYLSKEMIQKGNFPSKGIWKIMNPTYVLITKEILYELGLPSF